MMRNEEIINSMYGNYIEIHIHTITPLRHNATLSTFTVKRIYGKRK